MKTLALMVVAGLALSLPVQAEEAGRGKQPLSVYCNTVPELGTARSDSVDNWVKICTVWLNAKSSLAEKPRRTKDDDEPASLPAPKEVPKDKR